MQYRTVPGTDLRVSAIGFGSGGNAGLMVRGDPAEQCRVVARALELGITYFDTAPDYGDGAAEHAIGRALRAIGGPPPIVTTKVEIRRGDLGDIAGHVVRSAQASLRRLGLERVDILQIHNGPVTEPPAMEGGDYHRLWLPHFEEAAEGLRRLIDAGSIRTAGFISRGGDGAAVETLLATGLYKMVNLAYSLLDPAPRSVLDTTQRHGSGAAVFSPLAGGLLAGGAPPHALARPIDPAAARTRGKRALADRLGFLAADSGSMARAAYRFVLMHPGVTTAIGGFSSCEQMEDAVAAADLPPLPDAQMEAIGRAQSEESTDG